MQAIASLCMLVVALVTLVVGVRLLMLGRRTRGVPELAFGVAFLAGCLGTAGAQLGQRLWWTEPGSFAYSMNAACFAIQVLGTFSLFLATWRIFRPTESWAFFVFAIGCSVAILSWVIRLMQGDFAAVRIDTPGMAVFHATRIAVYCWAATESLRYWRMLRRRLSLGLADPVATQQILMWGISGIAAAAVSTTIVVSAFGLGHHPLELPSTLALVMLLSMAVSATMWCAFFPPQAMRRWATSHAS